MYYIMYNMYFSKIVFLANSFKNIIKGQKKPEKSEKVRLKDFFPGGSYQILSQNVIFLKFCQ